MNRNLHRPAVHAPAPRIRVRPILLGLLALIVLQGSTAQTNVPIERQLELMVKVVSSASRTSVQHSVCSVGILYSHHDSSSLAEQAAIAHFSNAQTVTLANGIPVRFVPIDLEHGDEWKELLRSDSLAAVIVTSVHEQYLGPIADICREESILSMTTVPDYVRNRLAVGVTSERDRAVLVVNVPISISEGTRFSSRLLKMAKTYR